MYQLYCAANTYAMGAHVLLEELGVSYEVIEVTIYADKADPEFLKASPHARVPALVHRYGTVFESGAIAQFLTDTHPDNGLGVPFDDPDRGRFLQWLYYLSSTVQPEVMIQFHPDNYFQDLDTQRRLKSASMDRLEGIWKVLNEAYRDGPWLVDNRPTAVDFCLAIQLQWPECFRDGISGYPNLEHMLATISRRQAYQKVMQWHQGR